MDRIFDGHLPLSRYGFTADDVLILDGDFDLPEPIVDAIRANNASTGSLSS